MSHCNDCGCAHHECECTEREWARIRQENAEKMRQIVEDFIEENAALIACVQFKKYLNLEK